MFAKPSSGNNNTIHARGGLCVRVVGEKFSGVANISDFRLARGVGQITDGTAFKNLKQTK